MSDVQGRSIDEIKVAAVDTAKHKFKGNTGLARAMAEAGCADPPTPQAISQWKQVPVERVNDVEAVSGVSRNLLRPDIFGRPDEAEIEAMIADLTALAGE
jgi:hypothetical protein